MNGLTEMRAEEYGLFQALSAHAQAAICGFQLDVRKVCLLCLNWDLAERASDVRTWDRLSERLKGAAEFAESTEAAMLFDDLSELAYARARTTFQSNNNRES